MTINIKHSKTIEKYLRVLYEIDVLSTDQISYLLGMSPRTVLKYLSEMKGKGLVINKRCEGSQYWHLLPRGVDVLSMINNKSFPFFTTTTSQRSDGNTNQNTRHDVHCSNTVMALVNSANAKTEGIWEWHGPTTTRTYHISEKWNVFSGIKSFQTSYHPDACIGFYQEGQYGRMYIEYDSGVQYGTTLRTKVIKCHKTLNLEKSLSEDIVVGFITHGGQERRRNMMQALREYTKSHSRPLHVVIACEQDILAGRGWSNIWMSNRLSGQVSFAAMGVYTWEDPEEEPYLIGPGSLRHSSDEEEQEPEESEE